jgi:Trk K+ transport system NAD-binding subunit
MSTLGFGDITFHSDMGRIFSVLTLVSGIVLLLIMLPFTFIQFFYAPWLEEQNKARVRRTAPEHISGHVILTHFDDVAVNLVRKFKQFGIPYLIVANDLQRALDLHDQGYVVMFGELDDPQTYVRLRIDQAAMVAVMNDDIEGTNIVYTLREVNDRVATVSNADMEDSVDILSLAGGTHVFQFTRMLGRALARRVLGTSMKATVIDRFDRLLIAEAPAMRTWLQGKTLAESGLRQTTGVTVAGMWEHGRFMIPSPDSLIGESTVLVLVGTEEQLERYDRLVSAQPEAGASSAPVLVLGGGRVGQSVTEALSERGIDFRVVEKKAGIASQNDHYVIGSAADRDTLEKAGINDTRAIIVTTHDDNLNIYLTIYCRRLRPDVQIIARASFDRNIKTLHRAGADLVMSFSSLVTNTIINLLEKQRILMLTEGLNVFQLSLNPEMAHKSIQDLEIRKATGCSVVAIKRNEDMIVNPDPSEIFKHGDEIILVGIAEAERKFMKKYPAV